ncbi:MAG: hypothetical protein ACLTDF_10735 [Coprococcus sp.]
MSVCRRTGHLLSDAIVNAKKSKKLQLLLHYN